VNILLVNCGVDRLYVDHGVELFALEPPLGLLSIATVLEQRGHLARVLDDDRHRLDEAGLLRAIDAQEAAVVGLSFTSFSEARFRYLAALVRRERPALRVVAGGPHVSLFYDELIASGLVDYCVQNEGETAMAQLMDALESDTEPVDTPNLAYPRGSDIVLTPARREVLDDLPVPRRDFVDLDEYTARFFALSTARGCPYRCDFCASPLSGYVFRDPTAVVAEIEYLVREYGARRLAFREDNFLVNKGRVQGICRELVRSKLDVEWGCECRVDGIDDETIGQMAHAGCTRMVLGVELLADRAIRALKGSYTVSDVTHAIATLRRHGIAPAVNILLGLPDIGRRDMLETVLRAALLPGCRIRLYEYIGIPGSPLYERVADSALVHRRLGKILQVRPRRMSMVEKKLLWLVMRGIVRLKAAPPRTVISRRGPLGPSRRGPGACRALR
jgi:radical SAM superfamily enzyme YgiQ (UPF0313 family)